MIEDWLISIYYIIIKDYDQSLLIVFRFLVITFNAASIQSGDCIRTLSSSTSCSFAECKESNDAPILTNFLMEPKEPIYEFSRTSSKSFYINKHKNTNLKDLLNREIKCLLSAINCMIHNSVIEYSAELCSYYNYICTDAQSYFCNNTLHDALSLINSYNLT